MAVKEFDPGSACGCFVISLGIFLFAVVGSKVYEFGGSGANIGIAMIVLAVIVGGIFVYLVFIESDEDPWKEPWKRD